MANSYPITIIGTGNVAWHLAPALENAGHVVTQVYGRNINKAAEICDRLYNAQPVNELDFSESDSQIFIIAVKDDALHEVATELVLPEEAILAHTAGSKKMEELQYAACDHIGVFYPLQTFTKGRALDFEQVTMLIEGSSDYAQTNLLTLAKTMSKRVHQANSDTRSLIHLSSVISCNFVNHMYRISSELLGSQGLEFDILYPIIVETMNKAFDIGPDQAQTGPAVRGDMEVLNQHREKLEDTRWLQLYNLISNHIYEDGLLK